jgi:hypothetical protein
LPESKGTAAAAAAACLLLLLLLLLLAAAAAAHTDTFLQRSGKIAENVFQSQVLPLPLFCNELQPLFCNELQPLFCNELQPRAPNAPPRAPAASPTSDSICRWVFTALDPSHYYRLDLSAHNHH